MHIITLSLKLHHTQLAHGHAHHLDARHLHLAKTTSTHLENTPIRCLYLLATRTHWVGVHYVPPSHPRWYSLTPHTNVRAENVTERVRYFRVQEHNAVKLTTTHLQTPLASAPQKRIVVAKQARLHAVVKKLHTRNLTLVHERTLGTLELETPVETVVVYWSILREQRVANTITLLCLETTKCLQPIGIMPLPAIRYLAVVP